MKKIIQIEATEDKLYCLTQDGKVYSRGRKNLETVEVKKDGRIIGSYLIGTYYWEELPLEKKF